MILEIRDEKNLQEKPTILWLEKDGETVILMAKKNNRKAPVCSIRPDGILYIHGGWRSSFDELGFQTIDGGSVKTKIG